VDYRIDAATGIVEVSGQGSSADLEAMFQLLLADPAYRRGLGFLRNRSGLPAPSTPELRGMIELAARFEAFHGARLAIVATDPVNFGMMRMGEVLAEPHGITIAVFNDEDEAIRWLTEKPEPADAPSGTEQF
jgi:hypothetical protein